MAALDAFPHEILLRIFKFLDSTALASVSLVSRHLHAITEPILYNVASLTYDKVSPSPIRIFLGTILARPELAKYVQALTLRWATKESEDGPGDSDMSLVTTAGMEVNLQYQLESPTAQALLLLHLLPNLERLDAIVPEDCSTIFDEFISENCPHPHDNLPAGFKFLREIHLNWSDPEAPVTPAAFLAIFELPSLQKLTVQLVGDIDEIESYDFDSTTGTSLVTHLSFGCDSCQRSSIARILEFPRALTHFSFQYSLASPAPFNAPEFGEALVAVRDTLQHLKLELCDASEFDNDNNDETLTIGSLRDWPELRSVKCALTPLLGNGTDAPTSLAQVLPRVIVEFVAMVDENWTVEDVADQVEALLNEKGEYGLDRLAVIAVVGEGVEAIKVRLEAVCEAAGVLLMSSV